MSRAASPHVATLAAATADSFCSQLLYLNNLAAYYLVPRLLKLGLMCHSMPSLSDFDPLRGLREMMLFIGT